MAHQAETKKLLDAEAASNATTYPEGWRPVGYFDDLEVHVYGMGAGDEVTIQKSNEPAPSNPVEEVVLSGAGPHYHVFSDNPSKIRVGITADGANGSNITAVAHLRKRS